MKQQNPFDQFDSAPASIIASGGSNPFDQFDAQPTAPQAPTGFIAQQRTRGANNANLDSMVDQGQYSKPVSQFHKIGQIGGGVQDLIGEGVSGAYHALMTDKGEQRINTDLQKLSQTKVGQIGIEALKKGGEIWNTYKQANPQMADFIESSFNIGGAALGLGGVAKSIPLIGEAASMGGAEINNLVVPSLKSRKNAIPDISIPSQVEGGQGLTLAAKGKLTKPMQKVYDRLSEDLGEDEAIKLLNSYSTTKDKTLLEAGGDRIANLAEGAAIFPSGEARTKEFFDEAIDKAPQKLKTSFGKTVSSDSDYYGTLEDIVDSGRKQAQPLYKEFYKVKSIQSPLIDKILRTPEGKVALTEAAKDIQNEMSLVARPDPELTEIARELGKAGEMEISPGGVASGLKPKTLDYIKRSMDATINKAYKAGDDSEVRRITKLKNAFLTEIDAQDPTGMYAKARATSGDYLSNKKAMEMGTTFLKEDPKLIAKIFKDYGTSEKKAYKVGVLKSAYDRIDNTIDGRNVATLFNKPSMRERLNSILSAKEYDKLINDATAIDNIYKLRNQITGNSRTALRQIARKEFDNEAQEVIADIAHKGIKNVAINKTINLVKKRFSGLNDKLAKDVADILYEADPKKKYQIVKALTSEFNRNKSTDAGKKLTAFYELSDEIAEEGKK